MTGSNPFQRLAELFGALARVFGDPHVQSSGEQFLDAFDTALSREPILDGIERKELHR